MRLSPPRRCELLLRVARKRAAPAPSADGGEEADDVHVSLIARAETTFRFEGMADFQFAPVRRCWNIYSFT